ncbi:holo-ACP synthase [Paenibacillus thermoaerophilus]|jgi:holo-[acyl-carrier protein] synthase|uniref:Holo-[acyl-carrier-protein] synthase n=1 Tax=Paenibacillus thermoaerophilus TaxID=1215385 RepID=A0ABW2V213_9BACL|nr:holo-ACP synthase [Paenibacillus thermoaerophilus]TMV18260.1 holo-[acyl-carrier-protein] synthase [Paenibacillus thermoaerophilus]
MIIGIGNDLVELARIRGMLDGPAGERFCERVLTPAERELEASRKGRRRIEFVAGRFAAKEAVAKALGTGIGGIVGLQDIEVLADEAGRPVCVLSAACRARLGWGDDGSWRIHVSLSHSDTFAAAVAIVERAAV